MLAHIVAADDRDWFRVVLLAAAKHYDRYLQRLSDRYPPPAWEWRAAKTPDTNQWAIYVRWHGTQLAGADPHADAADDSGRPAAGPPPAKSPVRFRLRARRSSRR